MMSWKWISQYDILRLHCLWSPAPWFFSLSGAASQKRGRSLNSLFQFEVDDKVRGHAIKIWSWIFALSCESQIIFSYSVSFSILFWRVSFNIYILHAKFIVFCFFSVSRRWSSCTQTRSSIETSRATTSCWAWTAPSSSVSPQKLTFNS